MWGFLCHVALRFSTCTANFLRCRSISLVIIRKDRLKSVSNMILVCTNCPYLVIKRSSIFQNKSTTNIGPDIVAPLLNPECEDTSTFLISKLEKFSVYDIQLFWVEDPHQYGVTVVLNKCI